MPDYHQIVDQIRAFVQSTDQTRPPAGRVWRRLMPRRVGRSSQRLVRCQRLLQQGLRSEAIQLAEVQPRLLDAIAALDFPERGEWDEVVQMYGLPRLQDSRSMSLRSSTRPMPWRTLSRTCCGTIAACPGAAPSARIGVMRKLAAQDPNNPVWTEDLRTLRNEVPADPDGSRGSRETPRCSAMGHFSANWTNRTGRSRLRRPLSRACVKSDAQFRGQQNRAILTDLETELNDAFSSFNPIRGRLARPVVYHG